MEVKITFNPDTQTVAIDYDHTKMKTWEFIIGVIEMAKHEAMKRQQLVQFMQARQEMEEHAMRKKILRP